MLHKKEDWVLVRGGKYTNDNKSYIFPEKTLGKEIPICKCGFPCDIRHHKDNYLYFRCAKKNIWEDIKDKFDSEDEPCNFFMKSEKDKEYQTTTFDHGTPPVEIADFINKIVSLEKQEE